MYSSGFIAYHPFTSPHLSPSHPNPTPGPFLLFEHDLNETHTRRWKLASRNERNIPRICPAPVPNLPTSLKLQESIAQYIELESSVQELGTVFPQTKPICLHVVHRPSFLPQWTHRLPTDPPHHTFLPLSLTSTPSLLFKHDSLSECPGGNCWGEVEGGCRAVEVEGSYQELRSFVDLYCIVNLNLGHSSEAHLGYDQTPMRTFFLFPVPPPTTPLILHYSPDINFNTTPPHLQRYVRNFTSQSFLSSHYNDENNPLTTPRVERITNRYNDNITHTPSTGNPSQAGWILDTTAPLRVHPDRE
ncbi:hypothetical protein F5877DRAFT_81794 [Lentinula edodes]|nr:hypothetical protein F5877DRAFT_81794 [Lentinula edodes]